MRAIHYLTNERKLSDSLVSKLIEDGIVYEDIYHNVVFVGYDVNNIKEKKNSFCNPQRYGQFKISYRL